MKHIFFLFFLFCTFSSFAQYSFNMLGQQIGSKTPDIAVPFLRISPDAAASGMGDAGIATACTAAGMYFNPAKMSFAQQKMDFSATYSPWLNALKIPGISYNFVGGYYQIHPKHAIAIHYRTFWRSLAKYAIYEENPGVFTETAAGISYSYKINTHFSVGTSVYFLAGKYDIMEWANPAYHITQLKNSLAGDIGFLYQNQKELKTLSITYTAGMCLSNIGKKVSYKPMDNNLPSSLPTNLGIGGAVQMRFKNHFLLNSALDFNKMLPKNGGSTISGGCEIGRQLNMGKSGNNTFTPMTRMGYFGESRENGNRNFATLGVGAKIKTAKLSVGGDVSYWIPISQNHPLQNTIKIGVNVGF